MKLKGTRQCDCFEFYRESSSRSSEGSTMSRKRDEEKSHDAISTKFICCGVA
jgi:hypothetical protein